MTTDDPQAPHPIVAEVVAAVVARTGGLRDALARAGEQLRGMVDGEELLGVIQELVSLAAFVASRPKGRDVSAAIMGLVSDGLPRLQQLAGTLGVADKHKAESLVREVQADRARGVGSGLDTPGPNTGVGLASRVSDPSSKKRI